MKRSIMSMVLTLSFIFALFTGCSSEDDGRINLPSSSRNYKGAHYQTVVDELTSAGFTNVTTEVLEDLITGWITDDGEVEKVTVDGDVTTFSTDSKYLPDVSIVVTYHTFSYNDEPDESSTPAESSTGDVVEPAVDVLTTDNCEDLVELLSIKADIDPVFISFSEKYSGKIIEFDGCIVYLTNHDNYNTRYDVMVEAGDYVDENTTNPGPTFLFRDVNTREMGIDDLFLPSFVAVGNNVHIIAEVVEFNADTGIFYLKPASILAR